MSDKELSNKDIQMSKGYAVVQMANDNHLSLRYML